jgi:hypothetical protein
MKQTIMVLMLLGMIILSGCSEIDLSGVSDEDLERISNKAIVCEEPYMRFGTGCCLDTNNNNICDNDENEVKETQELQENNNPIATETKATEEIEEEISTELNGNMDILHLYPQEGAGFWQSSNDVVLSLYSDNLKWDSVMLNSLDDIEVFIDNKKLDAEASLIKNPDLIRNEKPNLGTAEVDYKIENGNMFSGYYVLRLLCGDNLEYYKSQCLEKEYSGNHKITIKIDLETNNGVLNLESSATYDFSDLKSDAYDSDDFGQPSECDELIVAKYCDGDNLKADKQIGDCSITHPILEECKNGCVDNGASSYCSEEKTCTDECSRDTCDDELFKECTLRDDGCYRYMTHAYPIKGKCGVECTSDDDCSSGDCDNYECKENANTCTELIVAKYCDGDNLKADKQMSDCSITHPIIEECAYGCQDSPPNSYCIQAE